MSIHNQHEYKLPNGQTISIQKRDNDVWEVACWNIDDTAHWYKEFYNEDLAKAEFNKWK